MTAGFKVVAGALLLVGLEEPPSLDPAKRAAVVAAYESSVESLRSYDLQLTFTRRQLVREVSGDPKVTGKSERRFERATESESKVEKYRVRYWFDSGKCRIEKYLGDKDATSKPVIASSFDGESLRQLNPDHGYISDYTGTGAFQQGYGLPYFYLYRYYEGRYGYVDLLKHPNARFHSEGGLIRVDVPFRPKEILSKTEFRIWLDPRKGSMPVAVETRLETQKSRNARLENDIAEVLPGVWAPVRSTYTVFLVSVEPGSEFYGQPFERSEQVVDREFSKFNVPIEHSLFHVDFPAGVNVVDRIRNMNYIAGKSKVKDHLDDLAMQGRAGLAELENVRPPMEPAMRVGGFWSTGRLVGINAAVLLVLLAGLYARRRFATK